MSLRRTCLVVLMVLVAAFVALYPYVNVAGFCGSSVCPDVLQAPHSASHLPDVSVVAVLAAVPTVVTSAAFRARRDTSEARIAEWCKWGWNLGSCDMPLYEKIRDRVEVIRAADQLAGIAEEIAEVRT